MLKHYQRNNYHAAKKLLCFAAVMLFVVHSRSQYAIEPDNPQTRHQGAETINSLRGSGICFTPNKGQIIDMEGKLRSDILYKGEDRGSDIYLRKTGISYVYSNMGEVMLEIDEQVEALIKARTITEADEHKKKDELLQKENIKVHRVDMDFVNCNTNLTTANEDQVDGYQNFYYAHCSNGITNVKQYNKVYYKNIYNNIDITYYGDKQNGIKYDLIVKPHVDPKQIKIRWTGAESIHINREGNLVIKTSLNELTELIPKVYQNINGKIVDVMAKYVLNGTTVNFELGTWNTEYPLVIDPWATYCGGNGYETSDDITTDPWGNVLITGYIGYGVFPVWAGFQMTSIGSDAFIVKFDANGNRLWATYYGGSNYDGGVGITTDNFGNVFVSGYTESINFPVWSGVQMALAGASDAFVVKFDATGTRMWATFYGGSKIDKGGNIITDNLGNVIVTGWTNSLDFPLLLAFQTLFGGGSSDAFVTKLNSAGIPLWSTFYGGNGVETWGWLPNCIAIDNTNNVIISGSTSSGNFPVTAAAFQMGYGGGGCDAFIVKFNPAGTRLWATYCGGNSDDNAIGITTDNVGNIIITGNTRSTNFPVWSGIQMVFGGWGSGFPAGDAFLMKFDPGGLRLWGTYYGTSIGEWGWDVVSDTRNNIYLYMEAEDLATPKLVDPCSYQPAFGGIEDQLIVKFTPSGQKICATYFGGTSEDDLEPGSGGIAIFGNSLFITGLTMGNGYPVTPGAFQTTFAGSSDPFIASMCTNICEGKVLGLNYTASTTSVCANAPVTFTPSITNSCDTTGYKFHWIFAGGIPVSSDSVKPTVIFSGVGTHDVKLVLTTVCKKDSITKSNYINITPCATCDLVGQFTKGTSSCSGCGCKQWILVYAEGGTSPYTYSWPDGYNKRYKSQLCPGTYTINIKDKNGCSVNVNLTAP